MSENPEIQVTGNEGAHQHWQKVCRRTEAPTPVTAAWTGEGALQGGDVGLIEVIYTRSGSCGPRLRKFRED